MSDCGWLSNEELEMLHRHLREKSTIGSDVSADLAAVHLEGRLRLIEGFACAEKGNSDS